MLKGKYILLLYLCIGFIIACNYQPVIPENVNFAEHIAPIIYSKCTPCHNADGGAPFSLSNYKETQRKAKTLLKVINEGYMPPWPADTSYSKFLNQKQISQYEIQLIEKWIAQQMPLGDTTKLKNYIAPIILNKPDTIISFCNAITLNSNNKDQFIIGNMPFEQSEKKYVRYMACIPDKIKRLHHVNTHLISYKPNEKTFNNECQFLDHELYQNQSQVIHQLLGVLNDNNTYPELLSSVCNYLPGQEPLVYPKGIGGFVMPEQGSWYINDLHYGPGDTLESDQTQFAIYYTNDKPLRPLQEFQIGTLGKSPVKPTLIVPANEIDTFTIDYTLEKDISLLSIIPHMHLIGKYFEAYALLPSNKKVPLIKIPKWQFRWQYAYTFLKPVVLPKGSRLHVDAIYDNTEKNINNPYNPPQVIIERHGSMRTTDEMLQLICVYIDYQDGDEGISLAAEKN